MEILYDVGSNTKFDMQVLKNKQHIKIEADIEKISTVEAKLALKNERVNVKIQDKNSKVKRRLFGN